MMMVNGGHGDVAVINGHENGKRIHRVSSSYQWILIGNIQNNDSNDITNNNKYQKAQRRKHNIIAPAAVGP